MAFFALGSFAAIFAIAIIWATRPLSKRDANHHGTTQFPESEPMETGAGRGSPAHSHGK